MTIFSLVRQALDQLGIGMPVAIVFGVLFWLVVGGLVEHLLEAVL